MTRTIEPNPCPGCGREASVLIFTGGPDTYRVICSKQPQGCCWQGPGVQGDERLAIGQWNNVATERSRYLAEIKAGCPSGEGPDCKSDDAGSTPAPASPEEPFE